MKYNNDIDPIVKEIGLILEKHLSKYLKNDVWRYLTVDSDGFIAVHTERPRINGHWWANEVNSSWDSVPNSEDVLTTFSLYKIWDKCLFRLGAKSE